MILSSKTSLKFANAGKQRQLAFIIDEYKRVVNCFVDILWPTEKVSVLLPKEITAQVETCLSARLLQCAGKQASAIVRGTRQKQSKRLWQINAFKKADQFKKARKLQVIYDSKKMSKPAIDAVNPELDSRFVKIDLYNHTSFDGWLHLSSLGNRLLLDLPFKKTKHLNKLIAMNGKMKAGVRLSKSESTLMVDVPLLTAKHKAKKVLGVDIGVNSCLSTFDGKKSEQSSKNVHGHDLNSIGTILARRKRGSKGFLRAQRHRTNYINWCMNKIDWRSTKILRIEKIRHLRFGKNTSRKLKHFTYKPILDRLKLVAAQYDVRVEEISPTYTSQRCSDCGWTRRSNRAGQQFTCTACGHSANADENAACNIQANLPAIGKKDRLLHKNRTGFYWHEASKEPIVPCVKEATVGS